jgi:Tfp pilus assembly protein PilF
VSRGPSLVLPAAASCAAATAAFALGRAYATAGDAPDARAPLQRALAIDPKFARAAAALKALP